MNDQMRSRDSLRRALAASTCCPMCDMDLEIPSGKCPGHDKCNEITQYLHRCDQKGCFVSARNDRREENNHVNRQ